MTRIGLVSTYMQDEIIAHLEAAGFSAVAIPVFAGQLEKSREAVDLANVRSVYAEVMTAAITEDTNSPYHQADGSYLAEAPLGQAKSGWTTKMDNIAIGGVAYSDDVHWLYAPESKGSCKVYFKTAQSFSTGAAAKRRL